MIGGFILGALLLAIGLLVVVGSGTWWQQTMTCVMYFQGAVQGLQPGASVNFRGVKLGSVKAVKMLFDQQSLEIRIPVLVELVIGTRADADIMRERDHTAYDAIRRLVARGLRAQLQLESLVTGQLFVQLDLYPGAESRQAEPDPATGLLEIPTVPTTLQEVTSTVRKAIDKVAELPMGEMLHNLERTLQGVERLVNAPEILETFRSLHQALAEVQQLTRRVGQDMGTLTGSASSTLGSVQRLAAGTQQLVQQAEKHLGRVANSATTTLGQVEKLVQHTDQQMAPLFVHLGQASGAAVRTLEQTREALTAMQKALAPNAPVGYEIGKTLRELSAAAQSLRLLSDYLERHPNAVLFGRREAAPQ